MNIGYHIPSLETIYAQRTIYHGFKHAFEDLGHQFFTFTANDKLEEFLETNKIEIFITASHFYYRKFIDFNVLKAFRNKGLVVFTKIDFWNSPLSVTRINEAKSMKNDQKVVRLIREGLLGDIYFHVVEQGDRRMEGFQEATGATFATIPLAADKLALTPKFEKKFEADISYVGTYLTAKKEYFRKYVFPLKNKYNLQLYGQDWTLRDRILGFFQKIGQYFNLPLVKSLQKPKLKLEEEASIYTSSKVSINVHESYQKEFGGDCNERTFKIPLCGGFEITDNVACIKKYFKENEEMVIAENEKDWFEKIDFFIKNPEKRKKIIEAGKKRVLRDHTYHSRVGVLLRLYESLKNHA